MRNSFFAPQTAIACAALTACMAGAAAAFTPPGYPGALWGTAGRECNGVEGTNAEGFIRQGIDWVKFEQGQHIQTYVLASGRARSINENYYNEYTPSAGAMFSTKYFDMGAEFGWPHYTEINTNTHNHSVFLSWFPGT